MTNTAHTAAMPGIVNKRIDVIKLTAKIPQWMSCLTASSALLFGDVSLKVPMTAIASDSEL